MGQCSSSHIKYWGGMEGIGGSMLQKSYHSSETTYGIWHMAYDI